MLTHVFFRLLVLAECFAAARGHHAPSVPDFFGLDPALRARFNPSSRHRVSSILEERASGQACGIQNSNTSCPEGQCCSAQGQCGNGRAFCDAPYCQFLFGPACDANVSPQGTNTTFVPRPALGSLKYADRGVISNCTKPGYVALTFDDGPYQYTSELLDILKKNNVPATFFVTGTNIGKKPIDWAETGFPAIIQRMIADGHQIGSHTWSHPDLNTLSSQERRNQMIKNEMALVNILGFWPTYMRPPYDSCQRVTGCLADIGALGYHLIEFNVNSNDYQNLTPDLYPLTQNNITVAMQGGNPATSDYIVYSHDILPLTVRNLTQWMIDTISAQGYKFATVGDCLEDPMENWYRDPTTGLGLANIVVNPANASLSVKNASSADSVSTSATGTATGAAAASAVATTSRSNSVRYTCTGMTGFYLMLLAISIQIFW